MSTFGGVSINQGPNFDAVNPAFNNVVGQRRKPSSGDINQIRDMYQCGGAERHVKRKVVSKSMWSFFGFEQDSMSRWNAGIWGSCRKAETRLQSSCKINFTIL